MQTPTLVLANAALSQYGNYKGPEGSIMKRLKELIDIMERKFQLGDIVIATADNAGHGIHKGDKGHIKYIDPYYEYATVIFGSTHASMDIKNLKLTKF